MAFVMILILYLVYGVFSLLPWYAFSSGGIQPVDFFLITIFLIFFLRKNSFTFLVLKISIVYSILYLLLIFSTLTLMLSYIFFEYAETLFLFIQELYYIVIVVACVNFTYFLYVSLGKQRFYEVMLYCLMIGTIMPIFYKLGGINNLDHDNSRAFLSFKNPNQLFIFGTILMTILFYLTLFARKNQLKLKRVLSFFESNVFLFLALLSFSRLSVVFLVMYAIYYFALFDFKVEIKLKVIFYVIIAFLAFFVLWFLFGEFFSHYVLIRRAEDISASSIQSDAMFRVFEGIEYSFSNAFFFMFGTGQASNPLRIEGLEFHDNFVGIFNQTGIICLLLYVLLNIFVVYDLWKKGWFYLVPFFSYFLISLFHYTFRERFNWLFWAIIIFILSYQKFDENRQNRLVRTK